MKSLTGVIVKGVGGFYYVKAEDCKLYECKARGLFRKDRLTPLPGDKVGFSVINTDEGEGFIEYIHPRKCQLVRPAVANVDQLAIVISVKDPRPDFLFLDKLIVIAQKENISPFICINKSDLDIETEYVRIMKMYKNAGFPVIAMSSKTGAGIESLRENLAGKITVLAGQSGVGKSTILNRIIGSWVMETGNVSERIKRGRHTTRHAELFQLSFGGYVADTPGFSSLELIEIEAEELQYFYPEFSRYIGKCRFSSCNHVGEPGCSVKRDVDKGSVDQGRYLRYIELFNLLKQKKTF
ncbi:MAG: ribosome small subunit-dependent GTPase A [Clostridiaceae bacterium]|nr:ribosome small subunit-dependent GTPase A [Clostridiaceae bacterium]